MTEQDIFDRITHICSLPDDMIRGSRPSEWVSYAIKEPSSKVEPQYIRVTCGDYDWGTYRVQNEIETSVFYTNGTPIRLYIDKDSGELINKFNVHDAKYTYEVTTRKEYLEHFLQIAEKYVTNYNMEGTNEDT